MPAATRRKTLGESKVKDMKIALFSDVHGRLRIVLHLLRNWQMAHQTRLDCALAAGDLGVFPDVAKMDKATRRWIEADPEEAGFSRFFTRPQPTVERLFRSEHGPFSDVSCPIFFIPGNHEDYDFISTKAHTSAGQDTFAVDCYERFHCIRDGAIIRLRGQDGRQLRIAGIWGIEKTVPHAPYRVNPATIEKLAALKENSFDLLLTHDAPGEAHPIGGSQAVAAVVKACKPKVHLFGHVHPVNGRHEYATPGVATKSVLLKGVSFGKRMDESLVGAMGILNWDGTSADIEIVNDAWLHQMRAGNWEQICPEVTGEI